MIFIHFCKESQLMQRYNFCKQNLLGHDNRRCRLLIFLVSNSGMYNKWKLVFCSSNKSELQNNSPQKLQLPFSQSYCYSFSSCVAHTHKKNAYWRGFLHCMPELGSDFTWSNDSGGQNFEFKTK